jgi:hypothetical protein
MWGGLPVYSSPLNPGGDSLGRELLPGIPHNQNTYIFINVRISTNVNIYKTTG